MNSSEHSRSDQDDDFVKDIEEVSNEEDDFENMMEETIAAHHKLKERDVPINRPESGNRPQSATRNRLESAKVGGPSNLRENYERKAESAQPTYEKPSHKVVLNKDAFYERFNEYVGSNHINPEDMWQMNKERLNYDEFKRCLESIGFKYSKEELEDVMFDISDPEFYVTLDAFCRKIESWRSGKKADDALEQIKENAMKLVSESKKKMNQEKKGKNILIRPVSSNAYGGGSRPFSGNARPFSGISAISTKSKQTQGTQPELNPENTTTENNRTQNKSTYYLKKAKEKEAKIDQILALTINKGKNEYEYECLNKMGEANELCQKLGSMITYRAFRSSDGSLKCNVYEYDKFKKEITMKELHREYNHLYQQMIEKMNLKSWEVAAMGKKSGGLAPIQAVKKSVGKEDKGGSDGEGGKFRKALRLTQGSSFEGHRRCFDEETRQTCSHLTLVLTSRDESLGKEAVNNLIKLESNSKDSLYYHSLDINDKESRDKFKEWVQRIFGKFDVLVNNAGVLLSNELFNPDYFATISDVEKIINKNYHNTRALAEELLPKLAADGKIINVSGGLGAWKIQGEPLLKLFTKPDFGNKDLENIYTTYKKAVAAKYYKDKGFTTSPYRLSKALLNVWTHYILTKSLNGDQQAFVMTPGHCRTDMGGEKAPRSPDDGADTIKYLIVDIPLKADQEVNGKFFADRKFVDFI